MRESGARLRWGFPGSDPRRPHAIGRADAAGRARPLGPYASSEAARWPRSRFAGNRARTLGARIYAASEALPVARAPSLPLPKTRFQPIAARDDLDRRSSPAQRCLATRRRAAQQSLSLQAPLAGLAPGRFPRAFGRIGRRAGGRTCHGRRREELLRPSAAECQATTESVMGARSTPEGGRPADGTASFPRCSRPRA